MRAPDAPLMVSRSPFNYIIFLQTANIVSVLDLLDFLTGFLGAGFDPESQDLKDLMRKAGDVTYADAHKDRRNEG